MARIAMDEGPVVRDDPFTHWEVAACLDSEEQQDVTGLWDGEQREWLSRCSTVRLLESRIQL